MKLIWLLIFCVFSFTTQLAVTNEGKVSKKTPKIITSNNVCVYADLDEFSGSSLKVKVTVKNGDFLAKIMYWGGVYYQPTNQIGVYILNVYKNYDSEEKENNSTTLYFYISPSSKYDYVLLAIPHFKGQQVEIEWDSHGLSVGAIVGIVFSIVVVVFVVIFVFYRKRRLAAAQPVMSPSIQPTYIPPVQPVYSQNVSPNYPQTTPQAIQAQTFY